MRKNFPPLKDILEEAGYNAKLKELAREERQEEIARNALAKGIPLEVIRDITGIDIHTIERLGTKLKTEG